MSTTDSHDPIEIDRENARRTAVGLGLWLTLTLAAVVLLLLFGGSITGLLI